ncbi:MAG: hypothetical protein ACI9FJ_001371 [Alteromonadaceae bacterium]|jgi:uncharacterized protein YjeT (DUF2065 family)
MFETLMLATGLMLIFEGMGPLLFPNRWANYMQKMATEGPATLRRLGTGLVIVGLVIVINFL